MATFKGQSSMEMLLTFGVIIAFSLPVLFLLLSLTGAGSDDTAKAQADASARALSESLNIVYAQGHGAKRTVLLNLPSTIDKITVSNNEVTVSVRTQSGGYDAISPTIAKIQGGTVVISSKTGLSQFILSTNGANEVQIIDPNARPTE